MQILYNLRHQGSLCVCVCVCVRACMLSCFSRVQLFATQWTLWTVAHQAPLSMGSSRQEYWSGLPCPPPRDLPDPGIEPVSCGSCTAGGFFISEPLGKPHIYIFHIYTYIYISIHVYTHIYTHIHMYTGVSLNHRQKEILPFATTWMHLEDIMLSGLSET